MAEHMGERCWLLCWRVVCFFIRCQKRAEAQGGGEEAMSIKPVFFNREMVKAVLDGKKTVMRVPVKCRGHKVIGSPAWEKRWSGPYRFFDVLPIDESKESNSEIRELHSPYQPEDILWVKEPWVEIVGEYIYAADDFTFYPSG